MSSGERIPRRRAEDLARRMITKLVPLCRTWPDDPGRPMIEPAGSLRRGLQTVGDIEIVAAPQLYQPGLLEDAVDQEGGDAITDHLHAAGVELLLDGPRLKRFLAGQVQVELFLVRDIRRWGWRYLLATGSGAFNKWLVTPRPWGALPGHLQADRGQLLVRATGEPVATYTEQDAFKAVGLPFIPPSQRSRREDWERYTIGKQEIASTGGRK